jgi:hypothetical protein
VTATFLGISPLGWVVIASAIFALVFLGLCALIGAAIHAGKAGGYPVFEQRPVKEQVELEIWLSDDELPFDFKIWKRPQAETHLEKPDLRRAA